MLIILLFLLTLSFSAVAQQVPQSYQNQNSLPSELIHSRSSHCHAAASYAVPENFQLGSMGGHFTYEEMLTHLDRMAALYPDLITAKQNIDDEILTHQGRPIYWLRISDNAALEEPDEPKVLYNALTYSNDPITLGQLIFYMWYLLENYASDPEIKYLLDNSELYFVPCVNPDGYIYNQTNFPDGGGKWAKNMRDNNGDGEFELYTDGVDLNRNFSFEWGHPNSGITDQPGSSNYRGPAPFSEPETQALRALCLRHDFQIALNYQARGNILVYSYTYEYTYADPALTAMGEIMTRENDYFAGPSNRTRHYSMSGTATDWMFVNAVNKPTIYAFTPLVGAYSEGAWPAPEFIIPNCKSLIHQNLSAAHLLLSYGELEIEPSATISDIESSLRFRLKRYGLEDGELTVRLTGLSPNVATTAAPKTYELEELGSISDEIGFRLDANIQAGDTVQFLLSLDNGSYRWTDTLQLHYRWGERVFFENGRNLFAWERSNPSNWANSYSDYYGLPGSICSPNQSHQEGAGNIITLSDPIPLHDVSAAELQFWAQWEIEREDRFAQVSIAYAGSTEFEPLCGQHTSEGIEDRAGEPIYQGIQSTWVNERIDLSPYLGNDIILRFEYSSDLFGTTEYFCFDELEVRVLKEGSSTIAIDPTSKIQFHPPQPNPADQYSDLLFPTPLKQATRLLVYDMLGRLQWEKLVPVGETRLRLPTAAWPAGLYFYTLQGPGSASSASQRLLVVH